MLNTRIFAFAALFIAVIAAAPLSASAQDTPETKNKVTHFTLDNGLEVVVIPDHRTPIVTHMIWYRVGAADEVAGKSGLAHFLEHLMFKGTNKNPAGYFSGLVAGAGGQENAFTSSDYTGYYQKVPREDLAKMMELEADRMTGLVLTDEVVLPERDVVLEEQNSRVANSPRSRLSEQIDAALYLNHPYGKPVIGWRPEIEKLNREDAVAFYKRFYGPNNAIVIVAGDVEPDQVRALVEKTYGQIPRTFETKPRVRPQEPPPVASRTVTLADPRVEQPSLQRSYLVPAATDAKRGESEALDVLACAFERWRGVWDAEGFAPIARAWTARAHGLGARCAAHLPGSTLEGVAEGLDADGALRLRLDDGSLARITAGDVFFGDA